MNGTAGNGDFASRLRQRERLLGYWVSSDNPAGTERVARLGYDYVCADGQHGLLDYAGWLAAMSALDTTGSSAAGLIRVPSNDAAWIGRALDTGARGVIVPLVNSAEEAAAAVRACRCPPEGVRSYGPTRSHLRVGPAPADANREVACIVMVETAEALDRIDEICATDGVDAVYVGPADLTLALGGRAPGDPEIAERFTAALSTVVAATKEAGVASGMHCTDGPSAAQRLAEGFTFATVSNDLLNLEQAAGAHLRDAEAALERLD